MTNSRRKGKKGEKEVCKILSKALNREVSRSWWEAQKGGADIVHSVPGWAIEVKRRQRLQVPKWWKQTLRQASLHGGKPCLWYRRNREPWTILVSRENYDEYMGERTTLTVHPQIISLEEFVKIFKWYRRPKRLTGTRG